MRTPEFSRNVNGDSDSGDEESMVGSNPFEGTPIITYVGDRDGDYVQETLYRYVGESQAERADAEKRRSFCCFCCGLLLFLLACTLVAWALWGAPSGDRRPEPQAAATTSVLPPFDCSLGLESWESEWSEEKRTWCCEHDDRTCVMEMPQGFG